MLMKYIVSTFLFAVLCWCYSTELLKIFYISMFKMFRSVQTTKEIPMKRQRFVSVVGIKPEEIICKISQ